MTNSLAKQLAPEGIRVNSVRGPWSHLDTFTGSTRSTTKKYTLIRKNTLLKRAGQLSELAGAYVFLASDDATYITGESINVNGGKDNCDIKF